jgi:hypothetical protein
VIADGHLAPANLHDLALADDLLAGAQGWVLGDRSYWSPARAGLLADQGVWLLAPPSRSAKGPVPRLPGRLIQARRRIETVIGQLVERDHAKRVWARDAWHLWSRWQRKLLSHTVVVYLCQQTGLGSLRFADLPHTGLATAASTSAPAHSLQTKTKCKKEREAGSGVVAIRPLGLMTREPEQARTSGIMRFSLPHDHGGSPCQPTHHSRSRRG